jgi:beta-glucosidase
MRKTSAITAWILGMTAGFALVTRTAPAQTPATAPAPAAPATAPQAGPYPFQNPDLPLEQRVDNAIALMTLPEKIAYMTQTPRNNRLGIPSAGWTEGLHGVAQGTPGNWGRNPITTTTFPQSIGLGETWDVDILRSAGAVEGYEARFVYNKYRRGGLVVRAPNSDLARDPRWGRTEESYGEDPFLCGALSAAFIKGLQGDDPRYWQAAALLKHFLANSNENGRTRSSSDFDERLFMEYYSVPFRMGWLEGGARCFMASYNAWNHVPMTANPVMRDVVVKQWGIDGVICTDAGSLNNMVTQHRYYADLPHAAAGAIKAGINQFLDTNVYPGPTNQALQQGLITEADIDTVIRGTLRTSIRLGLLDPPDRMPYAKVGSEAQEPWATQKNHDAVRLATQKSIVLLKNQGNLLPLDKTAIKSIAMIGPRANQVVFDWYSGQGPYAITPVAGVQNKLGSSANVQYDAGTDVAAAVALAKASDVAIVCIGNNPNLNNAWQRVTNTSEGREGVDRQIISLDDQEELVKQVLAANPKTVVVLVSSFPYAINWTQENAPAILHMANSSQEMGNALADVLFGDYNPAGRLNMTWPKSLDQLPPMMDYNIRNGRTYMYFKNEPLYPFGFGLSYTTFEYSNLRTSAPTLSSDGKIDVTVDVRNTGKRDGEEVVQLYVKHLDSSVQRPIQELKGFARVAIKAGETRPVTIPLAAQRMAYWNVDQHKFVVEPDQIEVRVGASSADLRARTNVRLTQ